MAEISFRDATIEDAPRLLEIYAYYIEHTAITFEWEVPSLEEFKERIENTQKRFPYIVAEQDGRIVGYSYVSPFKERRAYDWSVEMTVYLNHELEHQGIGKKIYLVMEDILKEMNILNLNACIGYPKEDDEYLTTNSARFHEHLGYKLVGTFHDSGFKFGRWYDMIWMEKMIGEHGSDPSEVLNYQELHYFR